MARTLVSILSIAVLAAITEAASPVTLSSIQPAKLGVNLTYNIDGQVMTLSSPCTEQAPGSACLPKPHAVRDTVLVSYAVLPMYTANTTDQVTLKACYSKFSQVDRPWRAFNNILSKSKACPFVIAMGKNSTVGIAAWKIPQNVPIATYFVRAFVYQKNTTDASSPIPVAYGDSKGFFEVIPVSHREKGLVVAAGICICVGPILFTVLMIWEFKFRAPKKIL